MPVEILSPFQTHVTVDLGEAHNLSIDILQQFQNNQIDGGTAAVAYILSAGRVLSPEVLSDDDELTFIKATMDWLGTYFAQGGLN